MKRSPLARRTPLRRGSRRVGQAARERVQAGGKIAVGRPSADLATYRATVAACRERANHRCERCGFRGTLDPHHVIPRSRAGSDEACNIVILCRWRCHRLVDAHYAGGRLIVTLLSDGRFCFRVVLAANKWAPRSTLSHDHSPTLAWLPAARRVDRATPAAILAACPCG